MIDPSSASSIAGTTAFVQKNVPMRLESTTSRTSSGGVFRSRRLCELCPALFTKISIFPNRSMTSATISATASKSATSSV